MVFGLKREERREKRPENEEREINGEIKYVYFF